MKRWEERIDEAKRRTRLGFAPRPRFASEHYHGACEPETDAASVGCP